MKRILAVLAVLVVALTIALAWRMRSLQAYKHAPSGGSGTIEGVEVDVTARMSARISAIHVREGDSVKKGQVLVELDCAEPEALMAEAKARLATAKANVDTARATAAAAQGNTSAAAFSAKAAAEQANALQADRENVTREATRLTTLYSTGSISSSQMDQVDSRAAGISHQVGALQANEKAAQARVEAAYRSQLAAHAQTSTAQGNVTLAEAGVLRGEIALRECSLVAPRDGVVQSRSYEPGEVVLPGARVLTLVDLGEVRSTFYLPNAELASAAPGKRVELRADAWPGEVFPGTILRVSSKAEFTPRNVQTREDRDRLVYGVEVTAANGAGKLRPGMPVDVIIEGTAR
jgi:HlyD family secretion protein